ncbi:hypothetical protein LJC06_02650 [Bacteroidales bacterium OttesenSCG-928-I14]|nr:hypothetical protein [Bacteroidales bacterium OttesenSCG-928-I14]
MKRLVFIIFAFYIVGTLSLYSNELDSFHIYSEESKYPFQDDIREFYTDSSIYFTIRDTLAISSIELDKKTYSKFKDDPNFKYIRPKKELSAWGKFRERFYDWLKDSFNLNIKSKFIDYIFIGIGVLAIFIVIILLYYNKPGIFYFNRKKKGNDYLLEDEDIHELNLDSLVEQSLKNGEYNDAIRWKYLSVLKVLHKKNLISYDPNKTIIEYSYEIKNENLRAEFRNLSHYYAYFRYGNGIAKEDNFISFNSMSKQTLNSL